MNRTTARLIGLCALLATSMSAIGQTTQVVAPAIPPGTLPQKLQSGLGFFAFALLAFVIGRVRGHRALVPMRTLIWGVILQFLFAVIVLQPPRLVEIVVWIICAFYAWVTLAFVLRRFFNRALPASQIPLVIAAAIIHLLLRLPKVLDIINDGVDALLGFTAQGADLVFGKLSSLEGPVVLDSAGHIIGHANEVGYFAFFVLPTIIFFACLTAVLYHIGIMQYVVQGLAWIMAKSMRTSGAETLSSAANIFLGQTEAPLMVKPFLTTATNSELMAIMVGGFANIASGVLGLYTIWLRPYVPDAAGHLAAACFITAPGSLFISKLMHPETTTPETSAGVHFKIEHIDANLVDAAARGTSEGLGLALNVAAMLITFTALVAFVNVLLTHAFGYNALAEWLGARHGMNLPQVSIPPLEEILGYIFRPLAWLTGVSWQESRDVGSLLGIKTVLNELIAYDKMQHLLAANPDSLSPRARLLATYALCGFANFASVGIQVGGISTMAPTRRHDLSRMGLLAMIGGAIASLMAACVVGVLI
jgi:concentrative nucleoside transporter, CNT family